MEMTPSIFNAKVMHKRLLPRINQFTYGVYYLAFPLSQLAALQDGWRFGVNRAGVLSFHERDHGVRDGSDLEAWARQILQEHAVPEADGEIVLISLPRVLGYVFNPVSFWLCFDKQNQLRAVINEVNNTFGESHCYLCVHADRRVISSEDWLVADKLFHVSPFLERVGRYQFRFAIKPDTIGIWIDYLNGEGNKQLLTALTGSLVPYSRQSRRAAFWRHPLVTIKTIWLIHWQAIKLLSKRIGYVPKPEQNPTIISRTYESK